MQIWQTHNFPKYVGAIDGTHLGLALKPEMDGEEYWTHKPSYAVATTLVCDDHKRIHYINVGWPGSVHDLKESSKIHYCARAPVSTFLIGSIFLGILNTLLVSLWCQHTKRLVEKLH